MSTNINWLYSYVLPLLPTVLTIFGWWLVGWRDTKKRRNDRTHLRIDAAIQFVSELSNLANDYYKKDGKSSIELGYEITFTFQKLSMLCEKLGNDKCVQEKFLEFKKELTSGDFQSTKRSALSEKHKKFHLIRERAFALRAVLDDLHDSIP